MNDPKIKALIDAIRRLRMQRMAEDLRREPELIVKVQANTAPMVRNQSELSPS